MAVGALQDYWAQLERERGLPPGYLSRTRQIESGGNRFAVSPTGPVGPFQFTKGTAKAVGLPLAARTDEVASARAAADLAAQNKSILQRALGRDPQGWELYIAHQQGGGGAASLLTNPNARAGSLVPANNISVNAGDPNKPASSILQKFQQRYAQVSPGGNVGQGPTVANAANLSASTPAPAVNPPTIPAPVIGAGKGLFGLFSEGGTISNFMASPEAAAAMKAAPLLASAMGGSSAQPAPAPITEPVDIHAPNLSIMQRLLMKKRGYV